MDTSLTPLTEYERGRKAQPVVKEVFTLPWNALTDQFKCPICLGLIVNTRVTSVRPPTVRVCLCLLLYVCVSACVSVSECVSGYQ